MAVAKKTVKVRPIVTSANAGLRNNLGDEPEARGIRLGIIGMVEPVLMTSGNYNGFYYVDSDGNRSVGPFGGPDFDDTKRLYYVPKEG